MTFALGFKVRVGPCLCSSSLACNRFRRFTSGVRPADLLVATMATKHVFFLDCFILKWNFTKQG